MANIHLLLDTLRYTVSWIAFRDGIYHFCFILPVTVIDSEKKEEKKKKRKEKKQAQRRAAVGRSRHKSRIFPHDAQNGFSLLSSC